MMEKGTACLAIGVLVTLISTSPVQSAPNDYNADVPLADAKTVVLDADTYERAVRKRFEVDNQVKGYATVLVRGGKLVSEVSGGYAAYHSGDGIWVLDMDLDIYSNIGSAAKFVTGIALLKAFETPNPESNPNNLSVEELLDQPITDYFPQAWKDIAHETLNKVSFRELLMHRSGFITQDSTEVERLIKGVDKFSACQDLITAVNNKQVHPSLCNGIRKYNNINFKLLGYLIAAYAYPTILENADVHYEQFQNITYVMEVLGWWYEQFMENEVFANTSPEEMTGSCDPADELPLLGKQYAFMYSTWDDQQPGGVYSTKDAQKAKGALLTHCKGQGGWSYSARDLGILLANLQVTDNVISRKLYDSLYDPFGSASERHDRMVWASQTKNAAPNAQFEALFGWKALPFHGGDHTITVDGRKVKAHAAVIRLPHGYHAVGLVNSGEMVSTDIVSGIRDAFLSAVSVK